MSEHGHGAAADMSEHGSEHGHGAAAGAGTHGVAANIELTDLERNILTMIQSGFPIERHPYAVVAEALGGGTANLSEERVFQAVEHMRTAGAIRRIGGNFDSYKLGYVSTLCAIAAAEDAIETVADIIDAYPGVTHDYQRTDHYSLWFTLIAPSRKKITSTLQEIAAKTGIDDILNLPALHLFKVKVDFDLTGSRDDTTTGAASVQPVITPADVVPVTLSEADRELIRQLDSDISGSLMPYDLIADKVNAVVPDAHATGDDIIARVRELVDAGAIRRLGAAVRHGKLGFKSNVMMVWDVPEAQVMEAGRIMAGFAAVSHCYERPRTPTWTGNMYTMVHGKAFEECEKTGEAIATALRAAGIDVPAPRMLPSTREFKKTSMKYFLE